MRALWGFAGLFGRHRFVFALAALLSLTTIAAGIGLLAVSGWFLAAAFLTTAAASFNLFGPSAAVRGLSLIRILSRYGERLTGHDATLKVLTEIRVWLFGALLPRAAPFGKGLRHGDLVSRLTADVDALDVVFLLAIGPMATALIIGGSLGAVLVYLVPLAGLSFLLAFFSAALLVPLFLVQTTRATGRDLVQASAELRIMALDGIEGGTDIRALGERDRFLSGFDALSLRQQTARLGLGRRSALAQGAVQALGGVALLGVLIPGIQAVEAGALGGAALVGLVLAVVGSFEAIALVTRNVARFSAAAAAAERLAELTASPVAAPLAAKARDLPDGPLRFDAVRAGFRSENLIGPLSFIVPQGQRIAIQGASGSGKSTLLMSILGLAPVAGGCISIGGVSIDAVSTECLYRSVALLEQDAPVFMGTVRENLALADPSACDVDMWRVLEQARLAATVRALPGGLDAAVGEAGFTLSVGEGRRLALARILLSPAKILLLDEPSSGLDAETERRFLLDLDEACAGRTVLVATHARLPEHVFDAVWTLCDGKLKMPVIT